MRSIRKEKRGLILVKLLNKFGSCIRKAKLLSVHRVYYSDLILEPFYFMIGDSISVSPTQNIFVCHIFNLKFMFHSQRFDTARSFLLLNIEIQTYFVASLSKFMVMTIKVGILQ